AVAPSGSPSAAVRIGGPALAAILGIAGALELGQGVRAWSTTGPVAPGEATPSFAIAWLDGGTLTDADLPGRVSVVTFWATWCGYCRAELADLDELDDGYDADAVRFVAVNHEGSGLSPRQATSLARNYRDHTGLGVPIAIDDGAMSRGFRVGPIPHTVVLDRGGRIRHVHQGTVSAATIADEVDALLNE
ncbi:MAG TPA: TlpA disulfide reductase family protein, partial [Nannocystaceae bacterium]|nr:TlpA disulfide reductase family protein [Nannocystaceae bacterium]